ncbi:glycosyltransferase family 4 protein [Edaphobacter sp. 12200R-103]|uniref:glycosyltransferase family 4 protein n=1 Tax=Edaphobacter sp. 12200R-103 TaxID=2703788 RepID=UPI00138C2EE1|nr:glycosyltransferase family 4 protein [Edaphobacter sp. 12200R-103]QHS50709.1 glycosyltransferase family 4 protein [Edaphobacter sp. 12200R-103]
MSTNVLLNDHAFANTTVPPRSDRRSLHVCMLVYSFYETDTRVLQYATSLAERGDIVDVIALQRGPDLPVYEQMGGVNVYRIQSRVLNEKGIFNYATRILRFAWKSALLLAKKEHDHPYDVVHVHNVPDFLVFSALYPRLNGARIVLDIHDLLPELYASKFGIGHTSPLFRLLVGLERGSAVFANHIIIANHLWRERYAARSSRADKCSVVRNRPDLAIFQKCSPRPESDNGKFLLTYPGSLNEHQGLDVAIRAFAAVADRMPNAEFHIYGEGAAKPALIALTRELSMQQRILFHNYLPSKSIAQVMANTDLAIEPKRATSSFGNEALSTKILEFMSLGVPVIASHTKIHAFYYDPSIIQYYENDDPSLLAYQILRLYNDAPLRRALAERAKEYADNNTWDSRKHEYLELIDSLVRADPKPALVL